MVGTGDMVAPITEVLGHGGAGKWWYRRNSGAGHGGYWGHGFSEKPSSQSNSNSRKAPQQWAAQCWGLS